RADHPAIERLMQSALTIRPNDRFLMSARAENFFQMGNARRAIDECDRALALYPRGLEFIKTKALSHEVRLEFAEALETVQPALRTDAPDAETLTIAGRILHGLNRFEEALSLMRPMAEDERHPAETRQRIWFQLAKTCDRIGDYDGVMDACFRAHALSPGRFDPAAFGAYVESLLATFSPANLRSLVRSRVRSDLPAFIIGMPRSGTTLLEQI